MIILLVIPALALLLGFSCKQVITQDKPLEVKIDVNVRIDVYQHAVSALDYISGESDTLPDTESDTESQPDSMLRDLFDSVLGVKTVYAAEVSDQQQLKKLLDSMKKRYPQAQQYKKAGSVGENHKGLLSVRDSEKMKSDPAYAQKVKKLVEEENRDRKQLYLLDAKIKNTPYEKIAELYAKLRVTRAKKGEWIEVKKDNRWVWQKK